MKKRLIIFLSIVLVGIFAVSCAKTKKLIDDASAKAKAELKKAPRVPLSEINSEETSIYLVKKPDERLKNRETYFAHEFEHLNKRRSDFFFNSAKLMNEKPPKIFSLGLSGGGIRSNAFQLGVLSGLNAKKLDLGTYLQRVDYISSVSGGSWANGAYWSNNSTDSEFFGCLDSVVEKTASEKCKKYGAVLRTIQAQAVERKLWLDEIVDKSLLGNDIFFSDYLNPENTEKYKYTAKKPYPIINITHSAVLYEKPNVKNHPFEMTPHTTGTIVDCGSGDKFCDTKQKAPLMLHYSKNMPTGFFVKNDSKNIKIVHSEILNETYTEISDNDKAGDSLGKALATSSAVVGPALGLNYNFKVGNKYVDEIRETYYLTDGGKSENLGFIPLIERGSDVIVISQIGYDPDPKFGNFQKSTQQIKKLFGREIDAEAITSKKKKVELVSQTKYSYNDKKEGDIFLIKPTHYNIDEFKQYLEANSDKYSHILKALKTDEKEISTKKERFPQTPTMKPNYDENLIFAYYLMGKYIAENKLTTKLEPLLK